VRRAIAVLASRQPPRRCRRASGRFEGRISQLRGGSRSIDAARS
jgi:hypothetical protein